MDLAISSKTKDVITTIEAVGVGVLAWEYQSTQQYAQSGGNPQTGYPLFSTNRMTDAIAQTFGRNVAKAINPNWNGGANMKINVFGVVNPISVAGGVALGVSALIDDLPIYKHIRPYVDAAATGALVGGALGGLFDDAPGPNAPGQYGQSQGNVAGPGVYQVQTSAPSAAALGSWSK